MSIFDDFSSQNFSLEFFFLHNFFTLSREENIVIMKTNHEMILFNGNYFDLNAIQIICIIKSTTVFFRHRRQYISRQFYLLSVECFFLHIFCLVMIYECSVVCFMICFRINDIMYYAFIHYVHNAFIIVECTLFASVSGLANVSIFQFLRSIINILMR